MGVATWIYGQLDADRIFEEMDRCELEARLLELQNSEAEASEDVSWWTSSKKWILWIAGGGVASLAFLYKKSRMDATGLATIGIGITVVAVGIRYWCRRRVASFRRLIEQMDATRSAIRKRRQLYFSISTRLATSFSIYRNPLLVRACRVAVSGIECLTAETLAIVGDGSSCDTWHDLYTPEMLKITARSAENREKLEIEETMMDADLDFEPIFETLIAVFKLHASEYSRFFVADFSKKFQFSKFWNFLKVCGNLQRIRRKMEAIEKSALNCDRQREKREKNVEKREKNGGKKLEIGWKQQTEIALEAILDGLAGSSSAEPLSRAEVELALRRTLLFVAEIPVKSTSCRSAENAENPEKSKENMDDGSEVTRIFEKREPTDIDMVFEATTLSDDDKRQLVSRDTAARDVLLDGSESRQHEASLLGELQMVLEPRRSDFERRERRALAKFYGLGEQELCERERMEQQRLQEEENFDGVGLGDASSPEPYDWRRDAENSAGIHRDAENADFLRALAARRVHDDVIE